MERGLSHNTIRSIIQDQRGFLWIGTTAGLNRYDGYSFEVFRTSQGDSNSLADNLIESMCADSEGNIWIGTLAGGLHKFDPQLEKMTRFRTNGNQQTSLSSNSIYCVYQDKKGIIWVGTDDQGLKRFDPESGEFVQYVHDSTYSQSIAHDRVGAILEDRYGDLWIGTRGGLDKFDRESGTIKHYHHDPNNSRSLSSDVVISLCEDRNGDLWVGTAQGGVNRYSRENDEFKRYKHDPSDPTSLSGNTTNRILCDKDGTLWFGNWKDGLDRLEYDTRGRPRFVHYTHDPDDPKSISDTQIRSLAEDSAGNLWVGTEFGLNKYSPLKSQFTVFPPPPAQSKGYRGNIVISIFEDRSGTIWTGTTSGGVYTFNRNTGKYSLHTELPHPRGGTPNVSSMTIFEDRDKTLWIGTWERGLFSLDRTRQVLKSYAYPAKRPSDVQFHMIHTVREDSSGRLLVATDGGLLTLDRRSGRFEKIWVEAGTTMHVARSKNVWLLTWNHGLIKLDSTLRVIAHYKGDPSDPKTLGNNRVATAHEDRTGRLWIGTHGSGLETVNQATGEFTRYTTENGLCSDVVYGVLEDNHGRLWLSTKNGLARFDPETQTIKNYTVEDGLPSNEFYWFAYFRSRNGELYFGTTKGMVVFHPDSIKENQFIPPVVLTSFRNNDKPVKLNEWIATIKEVTLLPEDRHFGFEFASLDFAIPEKNQYAYKLQGFDQDWIYIGTRRQAGYTNLDPGEYTFRVKATNSDGLWNEGGASLRVVIIPPWWQTWWFRAFAGAILVAVMYGGYRLRLRVVLREERLRTKIARDLHDDLSGTLSSISFYAEAVKRSGSERSTRYVDQIYESAQEAKEKISDIIWSVDPRHDDWCEFLSRCERYAADLLESREIHHELKIVKSIPGRLRLELRQQVWLIFKELIVNLVRHADSSRAFVSMSVQNNSLVLSVSDNGKGFDTRLMTKGYGVGNIQKRVERLGGQVDLESAPGKGTRWCVQVPL
jgi:ligand-binding sensor domain-containing protein/signal transduction histidine kinase